MVGLKDLDIEFIRKLIPNVVPLIPSVSLIYLFLTTHARCAFWLSCVVLFFLALQINFDTRFMQVVLMKTERIKNPRLRGFRIIEFLAHDPAYIFLTILSFIFAIGTFIILYFSSKDEIIWTLMFLCLLAGFYYITAVITYMYTAIKYPEFGDATGKYIVEKSKSLSEKKK
jgi:hypothetical protein